MPLQPSSSHEFDDDDMLALSGIQHFVFCRRQWALIHIEQAWAENLLTVEGSLMHERAHEDTLREHRGDVIIVRGLSVHSHMLGLSGVCDVVEFHLNDQGHPLASEDGLWLPYPVEYKRGRKKFVDADRAQLCAQAICLEEMFSCEITEGALYYGETRSREQVVFDDGLREVVANAASEMHRFYRDRHTPQVKPFSACRSCSLEQVCLSKTVTRQSVGSYIAGRVFEGES